MKKQPQRGNAAPAAPQSSALTADPHSIWKKLFFGSAILGLFILLFSGYDVGFHSDELDVNAYGKAVYKYYATGGADSSYLNPGVEEGLRINTAVMKSYGTLFELMIRPVINISGAGYEINIRHMGVQVLAALTAFLAGLLCLRLTRSYRSSFIAFWLLLLTPLFFGHAMFNPKDIPFAFGYILAIYMTVIWLQQMPVLKWKTTLLLGLCIGGAISFRIGGVMVFVLLALMVLWQFITEKNIRKAILQQPGRYILHLGAVVALGLLITVLLSPFIMQDPVANFQYALDVVSKFPQVIPVLFRGKEIASTEVPASFVPQWISLSVPVVILLLFMLSAAFLFTYNRKIPNINLVMLVLIAAALPVVIAIAQSMALYSAWRHLMFIYPLMVVFATYWLSYGMLDKKVQRFGVPALILVGMAHPVYWSIKNHPYEYLYFNELSAGFNKNYYRYETDYWEISTKESLDWMMQNPDIRKGKDITIGTSQPSVVAYLLRHRYHDTATKVALANVANHNLRKWDYCLLGTAMQKLFVLKNCYPPYGTIHTVNVDKRAISAVVYDSNRWDYNGRLALESGHYKQADSLLELYTSKDPNAEPVLLTKIMADGVLGQMDQVYNECQAAVTKFPNNYMFTLYLGIAQAYRGEADNSIKNIETAYNNNVEPDENSLGCLIAMYTAKGNTQAVTHYSKLLEKMKAR